MSRWTDRIKNHATLALTRDFGARLSAAVTLEVPDDATLDGLRRLDAAHIFIETKLASVNPDLVTPGPLDAMGPPLQTIVAELIAFASDRVPSHVVAANKHLDVVLTHLATIPAPAAAEQEAFSKAAAAYRASIDEHLQKVGRRVSEVLGDGAQIAQAFDELKASFNAEKQRLSSVVSEFQGQFSKSQEARNVESAASRDKLIAEFSAQLKDQAAQWAQFKTEKEKAATEFDSFIAQRRKEVDEIFGAIGSASLAGHFARTADTDAKAANELRGLALILMGMMVVVGGMTLFQSLENPNLPWHTFLFRLAVTIVIAIPAVYAAQESSKHRRREHVNRKKQVELASIDAYLVHLPEQKRIELKADLTNKYFGQPEVPEKEDDVTRHELFNLISEVVKNLTKAK